MRPLLVITLVVTLTACAPTHLAVKHPVPTPVRDHEVRPSFGEKSLKYLSCDTEYYAEEDVKKPFGSPDDGGLTNAATTTFVYALMASNAYEPEGPQWDILGWERQDRWESGSDLGIDLYRRAAPGPKEIVIAFRGTDFTHLKDWKVNFDIPPFEPRQAKESAKFVAGVIRENPGTRIIVTGHSLGGGLALNMSLRFDGVDAYAFNSSPRAFFRTPFHHNKNRRVHSFEFGEVLQPFSRAWLRIRLPHHEAYSYNFMDFRLFHSLAPVQEHSMYRLSRALLLSAMSSKESNYATQIFVHNVPREAALSIDPAVCGPLYERSKLVE